MGKRSPHLLILAGGIIVAIGTLLMVWASRAPAQVQMFIVRLSVVTLLLFLIILIARYFTLLWFGYLHHLEAGEKKSTEGVEHPPVSIIVPAYNEGKVIVSAIESLLEMDYPHYEVIVVDDGSTDDTLANASLLAGEHSHCEVRVTTKRNGGKASSLNAGLAMARYPIVLCMDADSRLEPQTIRASMPHFSDPSVGAVAGNVKVINRRNLWTRLQALEYIEGLNMVRAAQGFFRLVNIIPGPIGVFRRAALRRVGGYDDDTVAEDCDLTLKLLDDGWQIHYEPGAIAYTEAPERLLDLLKQRYRWTRGILQAIRKHRATLLSFRNGAGITFTLWYMIFEGILWPSMNVFAHVLFVFVATRYGAALPLVLWWAQLTVLDLAAALYCVAVEEERLRLVPYAIYYRAFFALTIDVAKVFATFEELFRLRMDWGKLERIGRI